MTFYYTNSKLISTLIIRVIPIVFFYYLALTMSHGLYIAVAILGLEAILEIFYMYKKGYAKIDNGNIERHQFFFHKKIDIDDVHQIYVYNDEWAFRTHENEVRIDLKLIKEKQRINLMQILENYRNQVISRKQNA